MNRVTQILQPGVYNTTYKNTVPAFRGHNVVKTAVLEARAKEK